jgi:hypothetical protein
MLHSFWEIDLQQLSRSPSALGLPKKRGTAPFEVLAPGVVARIEQRNKLVGYRVVRRDVAALKSVAPRAGPAEVVERRRTAMLLRPYVIRFVWERGTNLWQLAVFATVPGTFTHLFA